MPEEQKQKMIKNIKNKKAVECYNLENELIGNFESISEAVKAVGGLTNSSIINCCLGKGKTAYGFIWKYTD
jgi:hypothetical protein